MKKYVKSANVKSGLYALIVQLRRAGRLVLPGIRDLALMLEASNGTVVKCLNELKRSGVVYSGKNATMISEPQRQKLKYVYLYTGHMDNGFGYFPAFSRLWQALSHTAELENIVIKPLLIDPFGGGSHRLEVKRLLQEYDVIFSGLLPMNDTLDLGGCGKRLFVLDEFDHARIPGSSLIGLDNRAVGEMAAQVLLESGYRNSVILAAPGMDTMTFSLNRRIEGARHLLHFTGEVMLPPDNLRRAINSCNRALHKAIAAGYDSAFVLSDEYINLVSGGLCSKAIIPGRFGLITVDGCNTAINCHPPITAISHGTAGVCAEIMRTIRELEQGTRADTVTAVRVKPEIYSGRSLQKIKE